MNKYIANVVKKYSDDELRNFDDIIAKQVNDKNHPRTVHANSNPVIMTMVAASFILRGMKPPQWTVDSHVFWPDENRAIYDLAHKDDFVEAMFTGDKETLLKHLEPLNQHKLTRQFIDYAVNGKK